MNKITTDELKKECKELFGKLDAISNHIKEVERDLNDICAYFEYSKIIEAAENPYRLISLSWEKINNDNRNYRIMLTIQDNVGSIHKPLIETSINYRIKYAPHLDAFLIGFTEFIKGKNKELFLLEPQINKE